MPIVTVTPIKGPRDKINAEFLSRVDRWNSALGNKFTIGVGFRSDAEQKRLYDLYRSGKRNIKAAPPGKSWHGGQGRGIAYAIDLSPDTNAADRALAAKYGLYFPMSFEPWHVQPVEIKTGGLPGGDAVSAPAGSAPAGNDILSFVRDGIPDVLKYGVGIALIGVAVTNMTANNIIVQTARKAIK